MRRIVGWSVMLVGAGVAAFSVGGAASGEWRVMPILSGSMAPAFAGGDAVVARRTPLSSVREGDVIVYGVPVGDHHLVAHRVVELVRSGSRPVVRTKGDANRAVDPWVAQLHGDAAWRVETDVPRVGHLLLLVNRPWMRTAVMWLATGSMLLLGLRALWGRPRGRPREWTHESAPAPA